MKQSIQWDPDVIRQSDPGRPLAATEIQLLLCSARTRATPELAARICSLAQEPLDWEYLLQLAIRHRLQALLYRQLGGIGLPSVPNKFLNALRISSAAAAFNGLQMSQELIAILDLFAEHEVPVIVLKGPVLGADVYGDIGLRPFGDLDILVPRSYVQTCRDLLIRRGYRPDTERTEPEEIDFLKEEFAYPFMRRNGAISTKVDIHWTLTHRFFPFSLDPDSIWGRVVSVNIGGRSVRRLAPEESLLFLCAHGAKHGWTQLILICDLAEMLQRYPNMNWDRVVSHARRHGALRMLYLGLLLAHELLGAELPSILASAIKSDKKTNDLLRSVSGWLFGKETNAPDDAEVYWLQLRIRERVRDRIPICIHIVKLLVRPSRKDFDFVRLPRALSALYYLVRPLRVLWSGFERSSQSERIRVGAP